MEKELSLHSYSELIYWSRIHPTDNKHVWHAFQSIGFTSSDSPHLYIYIRLINTPILHNINHRSWFDSIDDSCQHYVKQCRDALAAFTFTCSWVRGKGAVTSLVFRVDLLIAYPTDNKHVWHAFQSIGFTSSDSPHLHIYQTHQYSNTPQHQSPVLIHVNITLNSAPWCVSCFHFHLLLGAWKRSCHFTRIPSWFTYRVSHW